MLSIRFDMLSGLTRILVSMAYIRVPRTHCTEGSNFSLVSLFRPLSRACARSLLVGVLPSRRLFSLDGSRS
jgi:hypothetical protein